MVLADKYTCMGFRLAGVTEFYEAEGKKAEEKLKELLQTAGIGIIILNEKTLAEADWRLRKRIEQAAKPSIITVPDKSGKEYETESLKSMVKRALGFELIK